MQRERTRLIRVNLEYMVRKEMYLVPYIYSLRDLQGEAVNGFTRAPLQEAEAGEGCFSDTPGRIAPPNVRNPSLLQTKRFDVSGIPRVER